MITRRARILVVDNNLADQELIREMLPLQGIDAEVEPALEGGEAIDRLDAAAGRDAAARPDVVLLDLHLSRVHGREVLSFIRGRQDLSGIPVIVFTTGGSPELRGECLALGADDFFIKPTSLAGFAQIATAIRRHLAEGRGDRSAHGEAR